MLKAIQNKTRDDKGFTLIELMVVVLIIAILIAIAIPTFLGMRKRAQDRAAQSNLRNGLTAAKAFYTDEDTFTPSTGDFNATEGETIEPSLDWADKATPDTEGEVAVVSVDADTVVLGILSASGDFFCIQDDGGATLYGSGPDWATADDCASDGF